MAQKSLLDRFWNLVCVAFGSMLWWCMIMVFVCYPILRHGVRLKSIMCWNTCQTLKTMICIATVTNIAIPKEPNKALKSFQIHAKMIPTIMIKSTQTVPTSMYKNMVGTKTRKALDTCSTIVPQKAAAKCGHDVLWLLLIHPLPLNSPNDATTFPRSLGLFSMWWLLWYWLVVVCWLFRFSQSPFPFLFESPKYVANAPDFVSPTNCGRSGSY